MKCRIVKRLGRYFPERRSFLSLGLWENFSPGGDGCDELSFPTEDEARRYIDRITEKDKVVQEFEI